MLFSFDLMMSYETYMHRCLQLALYGSGNVAPNPMVGAVLVHDDKIIGEGYHQRYGQAHAEVNCIASVKEEDKHLIERSTMYVSLEPCAHFGKTPPCADLIIEKKIPKVVIGCRDPFEKVNGRGIEKLKAAGVNIEVGILEDECKELNKRFFVFHTQNRPYIILKWVQTQDGKIAAFNSERLLISNQYSNRIVHKWRSEEMSILVGTNTALVDDPALTVRLWKGKSPIRLVVDMDLRLPENLKLFTSGGVTIVFNLLQHTLPKKIDVRDLQNIGVAYYQATEDVSLVHQIVNALYQMNISSVLVEGGAFLLQSFIDEGMWDEVRVICNEQLAIGNGLSAPVLKNHSVTQTEKIFSDNIAFYKKQES